MIRAISSLSLPESTRINRTENLSLLFPFLLKEEAKKREEKRRKRDKGGHGEGMEGIKGDKKEK